MTLSKSVKGNFVYGILRTSGLGDISITFPRFSVKGLNQAIIEALF